MTYEAQRYWDDLLGRTLDERAVAYPWLPVSINRAMYRSFLESVSGLVADHDIGAPRSVLDLGSGTGIWVEFWRDLGAHHVTGLDLTEPAVLGLRERFPDGTFLQADIGQTGLPVTGPFDAVSAMSVLLHIKDDGRWQQAWKNIADVLTPGGIGIIIEPVVVHRWWGKPFDENSNSKARSLKACRNACEAAGLELVDVRPATVLLANPIDARSSIGFQFLSFAWAVLEWIVRGSEKRGQMLGGVLSRLDVHLRRLFPNGPSAKVVLVRRR